MTIIDGIPVQNPFFSTVPDNYPSAVGLRPFFCLLVPEGILLNTVRHCLPHHPSSRRYAEQTSSGVFLPFCRAFHTQKWKNTALGGGLQHTNLALFNAFRQTADLQRTSKNVQALSGTVYLRQNLADRYYQILRTV